MPRLKVKAVLMPTHWLICVYLGSMRCGNDTPCTVGECSGVCAVRNWGAGWCVLKGDAVLKLKPWGCCTEDATPCVLWNSMMFWLCIISEHSAVCTLELTHVVYTCEVPYICVVELTPCGVYLRGKVCVVELTPCGVYLRGMCCGIDALWCVLARYVLWN